MHGRHRLRRSDDSSWIQLLPFDELHAGHDVELRCACAHGRPPLCHWRWSRSSSFRNRRPVAGKTGSHIFTEAVDDPSLKIGMIQTLGSSCGYILEPDKTMQLTIAFECDEKETGGGKLT